MNVPSADISQFIIDVIVDLSGTTPKICMDPASVGPNQSLVEYIYKVVDPSGITLYEGDFTSPDSTGNGDIFCVNIPLFNNSINWSGSDYVVTATMKDTADLTFVQDIPVQICPPRGNSQAGKWYGQACLKPQVKCNQAQILLSDTTNYDYKGYPKTLISKTITLIFPADATGVQPSPVVLSGLNDVVIDITYNGNYEARLETVYSYDLGSGNSIEILYTTNQKDSGIHVPIAVECYINLCPLLCEYSDLIDHTKDICETDPVQYVKNQNLIITLSAKILEVMINKECGRPVGTLIAEIKKISGFTCDCDCDNNGVVPRSLISSYAGGTLVFSAVTSCGDVAGDFTNPSPNNYVLTLSDKQYVFALSTDATTNGFSVTNSTTGCIKTYRLDINLTTLITNILSTIQGDSDLQAAFCTLVGICDPLNPFAGVDMKCIFPSQNEVCDYFGQLNGPHRPTDTFHGIMVNGATILSPPFVYTNAIQINAWLQTLGFGFGATDYIITGVAASLTSSANVNNISKIYFQDSVSHVVYSVNVAQSNCTSVTSTDKMQSVIDFICNIYDALYGIDSVLYKVAVNSSDTSPDFLAAKVQSSDNSVAISVITNSVVDFKTLLKTDSQDNCGGYLIDKFFSNNFLLEDVKVNTFASDYVITSTLYGSGYNVESILINGTTYPIGIVTTNLSAIQAALNAIGLGSFVVTSPSSNLVITSDGNRYTVTSAIIKTLAGPSYTTFNAVVSNTVLLGECAKIRVNKKTRVWTDITIDGTQFDTGASTAEYSSLDSLDNVFLNLNLVASPTPSLGTINVNPADLLPASVRPRTTQRIAVWYGWDGATDNFANYIIINTNGLIQIEYNILQTVPTFPKDSIYYPTVT